MISLVVNKKEVKFDVSIDVYNSYINEISESNKVSPAHNFLMRCVTDDTKDALKELLALPSASIMIASKVIEEFTPEIEITVGK